MYRTADEAMTALTTSNDATLAAIMVPDRRGGHYEVCHLDELGRYEVYQRLV